MFRKAATNGEPVCPKCGCVVCYEYAARPILIVCKTGGNNNGAKPWPRPGADLPLTVQ
jgi:hypothetical protein